METAKVAVVGAGLAGLTLALALHRRGVPVRVYEQAEQLGEVGAGIQVAPNAGRLLHRLGLGEHLDRVAVRPEAIEMRRWDDGLAVGRTNLGDACAELYGFPYYTLHRADLHAGLLAQLPPEALSLGRRCVGVDEGPGSVSVRFADGGVETADVVVGADGIRSVVRDHLVADAPRFSGQTIYRGVVPAARVPFLLTEPKVLLWMGPGRHVVCYPISGGRLVSFGATAPGDDWRTESWTAEGDVATMIAAYSGWHDEVRQVLGAARTVGRWALHDRDAVGRWSTDRVTIIGDAAHPMLPFMAQGANQAVEDAVVLAALLAEALPDGVTEALKRYEQVRVARTASIQQLSRSSGATLHAGDGEEQRRRDLLVAGDFNLRGQEWLYGYDAEAALAEA